MVMKALLRKPAVQLKHRSREAVAYLFDYIKPVPSGPVRAVIFAQGRTGSTLLESLLCSTGHFRRNGELLSTSRGEVLFPIPFIRGLSNWNAHANFIFHVKVYQLTRDRRRSVDPVLFLETLHRDGWKIIYLRRRNKVRHTLSNVVAEHRGAYAKFDDRREEYKLFIDCDRFVEKVEERFRFEAAERDALAGVAYHEVVYEDDLERAERHQQTVDRVLDFLSLERREAHTRHKKVNTLPLEAAISNYEEFEACLAEHGWRHFLDA